MADVTVPIKNTGDALEAAEINQIVAALNTKPDLDNTTDFATIILTYFQALPGYGVNKRFGTDANGNLYFY